MTTAQPRFPRMPALFIGHGSPMNTLQDNGWSRAWRRIGASLPRPRAVLAVSAHWTTRGTGVTAMASPRTIHDFGGFPKPLFEFQYPAPGAPWLAARVGELLAPTEVVPDTQWGLDHGSWSVLAHLFPDADVPVAQLSIDLGQPAQWHLDMGRRLAALRDDGVLLLGSGNIVHNLQLLDWSDGAPPYHDWALRFETAVRTALAADDRATLADWQQFGRDAALSVPTSEHYLPLLYIAGARAQGEPVSFPVEGGHMGGISMLSFQVGTTGAPA